MGEETLTIKRGGHNFTVRDQYGNILHQHGVGGTSITVVGIEQITILDEWGNVVYKWP